MTHPRTCALNQFARIQGSYGWYMTHTHTHTHTCQKRRNCDEIHCRYISSDRLKVSFDIYTSLLTFICLCWPILGLFWHVQVSFDNNWSLLTVAGLFWRETFCTHRWLTQQSWLLHAYLRLRLISAHGLYLPSPPFQFISLLWVRESQDKRAVCVWWSLCLCVCLCVEARVRACNV